MSCTKFILWSVSLQVTPDFTPYWEGAWQEQSYSNQNLTWATVTGEFVQGFVLRNT